LLGAASVAAKRQQIGGGQEHVTPRAPGRWLAVCRCGRIPCARTLDIRLATSTPARCGQGRTRGAAESLLLAKNYIKDVNAPMLSVNCDQFLSWNPFNLIDQMQREPDVNFIVTYKETSPKCSYVKEQAGVVVEVREKRVISNDATIGFYHWAHTRDFFQDAEQMIADDHKENGEYYVAPVYNYSIQRGLKVKKYAIDNSEFWPVGTPDDLMHFNSNTAFFD
jgi:dTDP-glucose pyrophosphorylase